MKIAYWSCHRGCGVTTNLAAVAVTGVLAFPIKITMMENHSNTNGISKYFFPQCFARGVAEELYYPGPGAVEYSLGRCSYKPSYLRGGYPVIEIVQDALYYIPQSDRQIVLSDIDFHQCFEPVLNQFGKPEELIFFDTEGENCVSTKMILEEADMVVVNLPQSLKDIHYFFQNYSSLVPKAFFIIGDYRQNHLCSLEKITAEFQFRRDRIGTIPHSEEFQLAAEQGRLVEYLTLAYHGDENSEGKILMQKLKEVVFQLMEHTVYNRSGCL